MWRELWCCWQGPAQISLVNSVVTFRELLAWTGFSLLSFISSCIPLTSTTLSDSAEMSELVNGITEGV